MFVTEVNSQKCVLIYSIDFIFLYIYQTGNNVIYDIRILL